MIDGDFKKNIPVPDRGWSTNSKTTYQYNLASNIFFASCFIYSLIESISEKNFLSLYFHYFNIGFSFIIGFASIITLILAIHQIPKDWKNIDPPDSVDSFIAKTSGLFCITLTCIFFNITLNDLYDLSKTSLVFLVMSTFFFILGHSLASKKKLSIMLAGIQNLFIGLKYFSQQCYLLVSLRLVMKDSPVFT